jgi:hypothetical protein
MEYRAGDLLVAIDVMRGNVSLAFFGDWSILVIVDREPFRSLQMSAVQSNTRGAPDARSNVRFSVGIRSRIEDAGTDRNIPGSRFNRRIR